MWNNRYPKIALDSTLRRNVEPSVGAACSLLLTNPVDIYALKLKRVWALLLPMYICHLAYKTNLKVYIYTS